MVASRVDYCAAEASQIRRYLSNNTGWRRKKEANFLGAEHRTFERRKTRTGSRGVAAHLQLLHTIGRVLATPPSRRDEKLANYAYRDVSGAENVDRPNTRLRIPDDVPVALAYALAAPACTDVPKRESRKQKLR